MKNCQIMVVSIILILLTACGKDSSSDGSRMNQIVLRNLQQKYNKEFMIKTSKHYHGREENAYKFIAYPKNNPDLLFGVTTDSSMENIDDNYLMVKFTKDTEKMVKPYIDDITPDNYFWTTMGYFEEPVNHRDRDFTDFNDFLANYPRKLKLNIEIFYNYNLTEENKVSVLKKLYKLLEFMKSKNIKFADLEIAFCKMKNRGISKYSEKIKNDPQLFAANHATYTFSVNKDELGYVTFLPIDSLKSYKDLEKYEKW